MKQVKILFLLLILLVMGIIVAACGESELTGVKEKVTAAIEEVTKIVGDDTREKKVSAKDAVNLVLAEATKWQSDAEVVEIKNEFGIFGDGKGTTWLIYVISRSAPPTSSGYG
jgi:hypothetical protein